MQNQEKNNSSCNTLGRVVINVWSCQIWFGRFHFRGFSLKENRQSRRSSKVDNDILQSILGGIPHLTTKAIGK